MVRCTAKHILNLLSVTQESDRDKNGARTDILLANAAINYVAGPKPAKIYCNSLHGHGTILRLFTTKVDIQ